MATTDVWPSSLPIPAMLDHEDFYPAIESEKEAGYEKTRPLFSRMRQEWTFQYWLSDSHKTTMRDFFDIIGYGGDVFTWQEPYTKVSYTVRIKGDTKFKLLRPNLWTIVLRFREA